MSPEELEQRLRRAIEVRRALRRATNKLTAFGEGLLRELDVARRDGARPR
jgi:hypothetical protein